MGKLEVYFMSEYDDLSARLMQHILRARPAEADVSRNYIYGSEVAACIRQTYYKMHLVPPDESTEDKNQVINFMMSFGDMFESVIVQQLIYASEFGVVYKGKIRVASDKYNVSGTTDPIIKMEGKTIICECKATHVNHYVEVIEGIKKGKYPDNYYGQLQLYLGLYPEADVGMLIIGNRSMTGKDNLPPLIVVPVERDHEWQKVNYHRIQELNTATLKGIEPHREFTKADWQCKYCNWFNRCWSSEDDIGDSESDSRDHRLS